MKYARFVPLTAIEGLAETIEHVRAHLSEIATEDDDPDTLAENVELEFSYAAKRRVADRGILVTGELKYPPRATYLAPDFEPVDDGTYRWEEEGGR